MRQPVVWIQHWRTSTICTNQVDATSCCIICIIIILIHIVSCDSQMITNLWSPSNIFHTFQFSWNPWNVKKTPCSACSRPLLLGLLNGFLLLKGRNLTGFVGIQVSPPDFKLHLGNKHQKKRCRTSPHHWQSQSHSPSPAWKTRQNLCHSVKPTFVQALKHP